MNSYCRSSRSGFTLIELSIVMVLSGLLMASCFGVYSTYIKDRRAAEAYEKIKSISASIANYKAKTGRLPCPADPSLPLTNANAGKELPSPACTALQTQADGTCVYFDGTPAPARTGICKTSGRETIDADTVNDPILIGAIPYVTIKDGLAYAAGAAFSSGNDSSTPPPPYDCLVSEPLGLAAIPGQRENKAAGKVATDPLVLDQETYCDIDSNGIVDVGLRLKPTNASFGDLSLKSVLDPYEFQMTYAVTGSMTVTGTPDTLGAISVVTEDAPPISIISPPGSAHYVIVAHGDNHLGAYNAWGSISFPCTTGGVTVDEQNCDGDGTFVNGLRSLNTSTPAARAQYFDDTVWQSVFESSSLWDFTGQNSPDIHNLNIGNVGIGTGVSIPAERLEVNGVAKAPTVRSELICDPTGLECFSADSLAGDPAVDDSAGQPLGTTCDMSYPVLPNHMRVVIGIKNGKVVCSRGPLDPLYTPATADPARVTPVLGGAPCPAGQFAKGFSDTGVLLCCNPYVGASDPTSCLN